MTKRFTRVLTLTGITAAMAFGGVGAAQASNGADDPPGQHQEHKGKKDHKGKKHHHHGGNHHNGNEHGGNHHNGNEHGGNHHNGNEHGVNHP